MELSFAKLKKEFLTNPTRTRWAAALNISLTETRTEIWDAIILPRLRDYSNRSNLVLWNEDGIFAPSTEDPLKKYWVYGSAIYEHGVMNVYVGVCVACGTAISSFRLLDDPPDPMEIPNPVLVDISLESIHRALKGAPPGGLAGIHEACLRSFFCKCGAGPELKLSALSEARVLSGICPKCAPDHPLLFKPTKLGPSKQIRDALIRRRLF